MLVYIKAMSRPKWVVIQKGDVSPKTWTIQKSAVKFGGTLQEAKGWLAHWNKPADDSLLLDANNSKESRPGARQTQLHEQLTTVARPKSILEIVAMHVSQLLH